MCLDVHAPTYAFGISHEHYEQTSWLSKRNTIDFLHQFCTHTHNFERRKLDCKEGERGKTINANNEKMASLDSKGRNNKCKIQQDKLRKDVCSIILEAMKSCSSLSSTVDQPSTMEYLVD